MRPYPTHWSNSPSSSSTSKRKEGDIVLLLPVLPHKGVELLQERLLQRPLLAVLCHKPAKPGEAEQIPLRVVGFYQAIAVEENALANIESDLLLLVAHTGHDPKGHAPGSKFLRLVAVPHVGQVVSGVSEAHTSAPGIEDSVEAGYEHVWRDVGHQGIVDPFQDISRRVVGGLGYGTKHAAGARHHERRGHPLARGVPHDEAKAFLGKHEEVVEVSTHLPGRLVERRDLPALQGRHLLGQRGMLDAS